LSDSPRTDLAAHLGALRDLSGRSLRELERDTVALAALADSP
jgi:hypothetical protein